MEPQAFFSHGYTRNGVRSEWWNVYTDTFGPQFVCIDLDPVWARDTASINDIKALAIAAAKETTTCL